MTSPTRSWSKRSKRSKRSAGGCWGGDMESWSKRSAECLGTPHPLPSTSKTDVSCRLLIALCGGQKATMPTLNFLFSSGWLSWHCCGRAVPPGFCETCPRLPRECTRWRPQAPVWAMLRRYDSRGVGRTLWTPANQIWSVIVLICKRGLWIFNH